MSDLIYESDNLQNTKNLSEKRAKKKEKKNSKFKKIGIACCICVFIIFIILILPKVLNSNGGEVTTITKSSLEKIIEISDMSTLDYTYNAITDVKDEDGDEKYYVAYEGTVTAGIDLSKIDITVDDQNKKIEIIVPEAKIQNIYVNMGTMDFIFENKKHETETVSQEAYKASLDDLEKKANNGKELLSMAKENAVDAITALITPWVEQIDEEYSVEIK